MPFNVSVPFRTIRKLGYIASLASLGLAGVHLSRSRLGAWDVKTVPLWDVPVLNVQVRL